MVIPDVIVENCIIVYCINSEGDEALVFDKVIVDDVLMDNCTIEPMQVLSVLFDFAGMVKCDVAKFT